MDNKAVNPSRIGHSSMLSLVAFCTAGLMVGCGGGGAGGGSADLRSSSSAMAANENAETESSAPIDGNPPLRFSVSPEIVPRGGDVSVAWQARHFEHCTASGGWSGPIATAGKIRIGPIEQDTVLRISCSGSSGGGTSEASVRIAGDGDLDVELHATRSQIGVSESTTLSWSSEGAVACSGSGGWMGEQALSGSFETGPLDDSTTYTLTCTNGEANALATVTVEVLDKTIRWQAPALNEDGSPVTDLAGYVVYWGEESRAYSGSHRIEAPAVTEWRADIARGVYYFAMTAFDAEGNESDYSNELLMTIP